MLRQCTSAILTCLIITVALLGALAISGTGKGLSQRFCKDRFEECKDHATDCISNPGWMAINCPSTCKYCHLRSSAVRCNKAFLNMSSEGFLKPGGVTSIFKRIISSSQSRTHTPDISQQIVEGDSTTSSAIFGTMGQHNHFDTEVLSRKPYILKFTNFLSGQETDELLSYPGITYERSTGSSKAVNELGEVSKVVDNVRTSSSYWCRDECKNQDIFNKITDRIRSLGGGDALPPPHHWEPFQLLKYEEGEYYRSHHDYSPDEVDLACGPRIFTFFIYLSDVIQGGNTTFPLTSDKVSVMPRKGDGLLWSNVESKKPYSKDIRTTHEAEVVSRGTKFGMNVWMHMNDFETSNKWACCG